MRKYRKHQPNMALAADAKSRAAEARVVPQ